MAESTVRAGDGFADRLASGFETDDLDRAMVLGLAPDALFEQVELRRAEGTHQQSDAALELLDGYGRLRSPAEIAALLALLPPGFSGRADRAVVIQAAALGRPAGESAQVALFLSNGNADTGGGANGSSNGSGGGSSVGSGVGRNGAEPGAAAPRRSRDDVCAEQVYGLVATFRPARDVARFVLCLAAASQAKLAEAVVVSVAERRSMQTVAALELALRANSQPDLASRAVMVALDRHSPPADISELIDYQLSYGPRLAEDAAASEPMNTHIRDRMPGDELVDLVLRQHARDPGRALAWSAGVAASAGRPIDTVVRLLAKASSEQHADLVEKIIATVATDRQAEDLVAFIDGCLAHGSDVFENLLGRVSAQAGIETISNVVQLYNAQNAADTRLFRVLVENAPAETLIGVGAHLAARGWANLTDNLLQTALKHPERYSGTGVAGLLAGNSRKNPTRRWSHHNITQDVVRRLHHQFSADDDSPVGITYLAELTCAAARLMDEPRAAQLRSLLADRVLAADDRLTVRYIAALRALGRHDLAEEFRRATWGVLDPPQFPARPPRSESAESAESHRP